MRTLRLIQQATDLPGFHQVEVAVEGGGQRLAATARISLEADATDLEQLRWYLEDYLQYPIDPAPQIASQVEERLIQLGEGLFRSVFEASEEGRRVWAALHGNIGDTRVEIFTDLAGATAIPWELLREPTADAPLAVRAQAFVRGHPNPPGSDESQVTGDRLRVLLVICRPGRGADVPFRSVGGQLVRRLPAARDALHVDVLRPPTFRRLTEVLREAEQHDQPYHVVHFDGHGTYSTMREFGLAARPRGYLIFENPGSRSNQQYVDGHRLGKLLVEARVPVLVLNACRSAHAELAATPEEATAQTVAAGEDPHGRVRAYGSLAQEVGGAGVAGVVAMRYSVYVVTAAQFIADLYASLLAGQSLGAAVTYGRRRLAEQPHREIAFSPRPLQDWVVPIVYEAAPRMLFERPTDRKRPTLTLDEEEAGQERAALVGQLPAGPTVGFYGRDETLLALDRAFDTHQVVLLHAFAGSGKTSTAVEFAHWYAHTGGIRGPVLFTSFEQYTPLARVLDQLGDRFDAELARQGKDWLILSAVERREAALAILRQVPLLWIWDNVEPVAGFPEGAQSAWSVAEQRELVDFLHEIQTTKARVLLTSRRDERSWLGKLPAHRVGLPPMPMAERVQLTRAIATRRHRQLADVDDWRPLLDYTQGNPLTVTVLAGQVLRDQLHTRQQLETFIARLRTGEQSLADDRSQGRSSSLAASLDYGLESTFTKADRAILALLHLFQGFVSSHHLHQMGNRKLMGTDWVPTTATLSEEAVEGVLNRAAHIGLLTKDGASYGIHPALPWYLAELFTHHYGPPDGARAQAARYAYCHEMSILGDVGHNAVMAGQAQVISVLQQFERNLWHAFDLARANHWWDQVLGTMQGIKVLYEHTGQRAAWARLVDLVTPELVDPATDLPRPGLEEHWSYLTSYRAQLARRARAWATAEGLQQALVAWARQQAADALAADPATLSRDHRHDLRNLSVALNELGKVLREQQKPACVPALKEALELRERIGDRAGQASVSHTLGEVYRLMPPVRDLHEAERWYKHSLELHSPSDQVGQAACVQALGAIYVEWWVEAQTGGQSVSEAWHHLSAARDAQLKALALTPPEAVNERAVVHNQLGIIYGQAGAGWLETAMKHNREATRSFVEVGNRYGAGQTRFNAAAALKAYGQTEEALLWAHAALSDFHAYGQGAAGEIAATEQLIADIQQVSSGGQVVG